jgi:hypothetical protein
MRNVWNDVADILKAGKHPVINLLPSMFATLPKQPRPGRPRVRHPDRPCGHYRDDRAAGGRGKHPPRCLRRGCNKRLRVHQRGACCEAHADAVVNDALAMLRGVDVTRAELIEYYKG